MDPEGLHKIPGKAPDTGSLQSKHTRVQRVWDTTPCNPTGAARPDGSQVHGRAPCRPPRLGDPGPQGSDGQGERRRAGGRAVRPARPDPEGARQGREERGCSGRGRCGGGVPCPDSHSPPRAPPSPGSAAVPLRLSPRASSSEAQCLARAHGAGEKSAQAEAV